jgi:hypothetical protein
MKKNIFILFLFILIFSTPQITFAGASIEELDEQYNKESEALKPPSTYSSVRTDYVFEQTALAAAQTTKILRLIYEQNREMLTKYDEVLNKYDEIIRQNNEIIKLLSKSEEKTGDKK